MAKKFKIGDRVKYIGDEYSYKIEEDDIGTVRGYTTDDVYVCVEWDIDIDGHRCSSGKDNNGNPLKIKYGYGWNISQGELKLAKPKSKYDRDMVVESKDSHGFKIGDRVIGIKNYMRIGVEGIKGTIKKFQKGFGSNELKYANICWDEFVDGHSGENEECEPGHGWNVPFECIKLLKPKSKFDKDMVVEVVEPGQKQDLPTEPFSVNTTTLDEFKTVQIWAHDNDIFWGGRGVRLDDLWNRYKNNTVLEVHPLPDSGDVHGRLYYGPTSNKKRYTFKEFEDLFL